MITEVIVYQVKNKTVSPTSTNCTMTDAKSWKCRSKYIVVCFMGMHHHRIWRHRYKLCENRDIIEKWICYFVTTFWSSCMMQTPFGFGLKILFLTYTQLGDMPLHVSYGYCFLGDFSNVIHDIWTTGPIYKRSLDIRIRDLRSAHSWFVYLWFIEMCKMVFKEWKSYCPARLNCFDAAR